MTKNDYRKYFNDLAEYLKLTKFLDQVSISQSNFSRFLKSSNNDNLLSLDKLESLKLYINKEISKLL